MNMRTLVVLIVMNVALLAALIVTFAAPEPAEAQLGGGGNQYLLISGQVQGRAQQAGVYVAQCQHRPRRRDDVQQLQ